MREYRLARNAGYTNPNCPGYSDLTRRQGYYIMADSSEDALVEMSDRFPDDDAGFTCQEWQPIESVEIVEVKE